MAKKGDTVISAVLDDDDINRQIASTLKNIENSTNQIANRMQSMTDSILNSFNKVSDGTKKLNQDIKKNLVDDKSLESLGTKFKELGNVDTSKVTTNVTQLQSSVSRLNGEMKPDVFSNYIKGLTAGNTELQHMNEYYKQLEANSKRIAATESRASARVSIAQQGTARTVLAMPAGDIDSISAKISKLKELQAGLQIINPKDIALSDKLLKNISQLESKLSKINSKTDIQGAMGMPTNTIQQRIDKIKALQEVRRNLSDQDKNYTQNLKSVNKEINNLNKTNNEAITSGIELEKKTNGLAASFQNLFKRVAFYASLGAITSFISNLFKIRGEYEMLERSLGAILGSYSEGTKIFNQQQALALKSPFTVIQLGDATKQLAAYGFAVDELVPVTTKLADISAGVGVEMSRIIYNIGQIKAKGILDARDLRDFGNAGLNVTGQLAQMYSTIEKRTVTTGEVFARVSNRMVTYQDVMKVMNQYTEEGGMFFQMQAKQAETLKGQLSNLTDAYNNMLNEMGKENQGTLVGAVVLTRELFNNWRTIYDILETLIITYGTYRAMLLLVNAIHGVAAMNMVKWGEIMQKMQIYASVFTKTLLRQATATAILTEAQIAADKSALKLNSTLLKLATNPWAIGIAALAAIGTILYKAYQNAHRLDNELSNINQQGNQESQSLANNFERLANSVLSATTSISEKNKAMEDLKRIYGDIVPAQNLTIEGLRAMKGNYDSVTSAIYEKIKAQTIEKQMAEIEKQYGDEIATRTKAALDALLEGGYSTTEANRVIDAYVKAINNGSISLSDDILTNRKKLLKLINEQTGNAFDTTNFVDASNLYTGFFRLSAILTEVSNKQKETRTGFSSTFDEIARVESKYSQLTDQVLKKSPGLDPQSYQFNKQLTEAKVNEFLKVIADKFKNSNIKFNLDELITFGKTGFIMPGLQTAFDSLSGYSKGVVKSVNSNIIELIGTPTQQRVFANAEKFANQVGLSMDAVWGSIKNASNGGKEAIDNLNKSLKEQLDIVDLASKGGQYLLGMTDAQIAEARKKADFYKLMLTGTAKEPKVGKDLQLDAIKKEISLIDKLRKEYEDLTKAGMDSADATKFVGDNYTTLISNLNKSLKGINKKIPAFKMSLIAGKSDADIVPILENLKEQIKSSAAKDELDIEISKLKVSAKKTEFTDLKDNIASIVDDIKSKFELGTEIKDSGALGKVFIDMFKIPTSDIIMNSSDAISQIQTKIAEQIESWNKLNPSNQMGNIDLMTSNFSSIATSMGIPKDSDIIKALQNAQKVIQDYRKKDISNTDKNYKELIQKYGSFYAQQAEITATKETDLTNLNEKFNTEELRNTSEYKNLVLAIEKKASEESAKLAYEQFKQSDWWIMSFENMDNLATPAIESMIVEFEKLGEAQKKNFSAQELREFENDLKKLKDTLADRTPFQTLINGLKDIKQATKETREAQKAAGLGDVKGSSSSAQEKALEKIKDLDDQIAEEKAKGKEMDNTKLDKLEKSKKKQEDIVSAANKEQAVRKRIADALTQTSETLQKSASLASEIGTKLGAGEDFQDAMASMNGLGETAKGVSKVLANPADISAYLDVIKGAWDTVSVWFDNRNNKINREIQRSEEVVKDLQRAYTALERTVAKEMGAEELAAQQALISNLKLQQVEIARQIELEKSRKKKDRDAGKIKDLEQQYVELGNTIEDELDSITTSLLGTDAKTAAESMVSSMIEAWKQGEDYMQVFEDSFSNMVDNMIMKAIVSKVIGSKLDALMSELDTKIASRGAVAQTAYDKALANYNKTDAELTDRLDHRYYTDAQRAEYVKKMRAQYEAQLAAAKEALTAASEITTADIQQFAEAGQALSDTSSQTFIDAMNALGIKYGSESTALSGLQKGISGITENTAGVIESYMNTLRIEVLAHGFILKQLAFNTDVMNGTLSQSLLVLRDSYQVQKSILSLLTNWNATDNRSIRVQIV